MKPLCAQALYTYGEEFAGSMSSVELVDYFLTELSKPGVWGGEESLRAISQLHNYAIHVFRENSERSELNEGADDRLRIVHRLNVEYEYTHYNSVLAFQSGKTIFKLNFLVINYMPFVGVTRLQFLETSPPTPGCDLSLSNGNPPFPGGVTATSPDLRAAAPASFGCSTSGRVGMPSGCNRTSFH